MGTKNSDESMADMAQVTSPIPSCHSSSSTDVIEISGNIRFKEDFSLMIKLLQGALQLPHNASPASTVCELQLRFRHFEEKIAQLSKKAKGFDALLEAVRGVTFSSSARSVDDVIDRLQGMWKRQEKIKAYMKRRLDNAEEQLKCSRTLVRKLESRLRNNGEKETQLISNLEEMQDKIASVSGGSAERPGGDVSDSLAFRKEFLSLKLKCDRLERELARWKKNSLNNNNIKVDVSIQTEEIATDSDQVQRDFDHFKISMRDELAQLRFDSEHNQAMVERLRKVLTESQKSKVINQGSLKIAPVSVIDQAVFALYAKTEVKQLEISSLEPWSKKTGNGDVNKTNADDLVIGKGAFGTVTLMRYLPTNIPVAVKAQEKRERKTTMSEVDADNKLISRTMKEVVMHYVMSDNPSYPMMHGVVRCAEGILWMALEFIGDETNATTYPLCDVLIGKSPRMSRPEWIDIALDVVSGIAALHDKGLLHNDLKANNILLRRCGGRWRAYIIDFGHGSTIAVPLQFPVFTIQEEREYCEGFLYQHLAPEIITERQPTSTYTDVYSVGVVLRDVARVCRDRDIGVLAKMCMRSKPYRRPTMPNVELSVIRSREKLRQ